jgi:hypothetical protein
LGSVYVATAQSSSGSVSYQLNIPQPGDYLLWCRILSVDDGTDSFFVSVDGGGDDIFDTAMEQHSSSWQWVLLNGRFLGTNRVLSLTRGQHTIRFRGRESDTRLDALYISNNPRFVPVELRIDPVESPAPGVKLSFRSHVGCTYGLESSPDLKVWTPIYNSGPVTVDRNVVFVDLAPETGKRFYRLMTQY